jgi:hypothetical protein
MKKSDEGFSNLCREAVFLWWSGGFRSELAFGIRIAGFGLDVRMDGVEGTP